MAGVRFLSWRWMLAFWLQQVAASSGNSNDPFLPSTDRASIQSFTFRMREDEYHPEEQNDQDESLLSPSVELNFWGVSPPTPFHQERSTTHRSPFLADASTTQQQTNDRGDGYFAVVSSQNDWEQPQPTQRSQSQSEIDRETFMASWREFMFEQKEQQDESDDDDDDNNDGSCSMLSNAAVSRSEKARETQERRRVHAGGEGEDSSNNSKQSSRRRQKRRKKSTGTFMSNTSLLPNSHRSPSLHNALHMRGGATNSPAQQLGSEVAKRLLVSALVTVMFEGCMGHVLEFIKSTLPLAIKA